MEVAEDAVAGPDDGAQFAFDQDPEGITVAGEDGVDRPAGIAVRERSIGEGLGLGSDRSISGRRSGASR